MLKKIVLALFITLIHPLIRAEISDNQLRQLFIVTNLDRSKPLLEYGGIVLFSEYFKTMGNACMLKKQYPNMTVFTDQEGGTVVRLPRHPPPAPNKAITLGIKPFKAAVKLAAKELKGACVDVNLAPVVQVGGDIERIYSRNPKEVLQYGTAFAESMHQEGIKTVNKHFPGSGDSCESLQFLAGFTVKRGTEAYRCKIIEQEKFITGTKLFTQIPSHAWMVSQNIYEGYGNLPAFMNPTITNIARQNLGYRGLLISDALWEIEATPKAIIQALKAVDWIMVGWSHDVEKALSLIRLEINKGTIKEEHLLDKLERVKSFKKNPA